MKEEIKLSFAPMEGVTGPIFRRVHSKMFGGVDLYYSPFLQANKNHCFKHREEREYLPFDSKLVPQVMASNPQDFVWAARMLRETGYREVNLNLGCPAATIVTKKKGAGLLRDLDALDRYLDEIFECGDLPAVSVKTRTGFETSDNAAALGRIYAKYPFCEVVIHPRAREQYYNGTADTGAFLRMREQLDCPVCYNGDIRSPEDFRRIQKELDGVKHFMIGRGLLADPALALKIKGASGRWDKRSVHEYLTVLWEEYMKEFSGERDVLFKMKELWYYLEWQYPDAQKEIGAIRKCKSAAEYKRLIAQLLL